ncbi:sulfotransferase domain-containing protein [Gracilibacillus salinarum]|uniref:Sulfotransferase n=1 Tax=Gracilibacillus salinarum TaxID=2932255 RepID=A0ABY4GRL4_9BACI|nr:sulfotransferase domain-containing protein [Gracilibacillus salinarum]UOQ87010.1 sulfotransferase [Gracilibacillus salinarum]
MDCEIKPNLFIVGAQKSGSTSLYYYLNQHPSVFFSKEKEPRYFNYKYNKNLQNGPGDRKWDNSRITNFKEYIDLFKNVRDEKIIGEATIEYLYFSEVAQELKKFNKNSKIIIILRDPKERAYSAYTHLCRDLRENLSFKDALLEENKRIDSGYHQIWHYKNVGLYYNQVKTYYDVFGYNNVKVVLYDDLLNNPNNLLVEIQKFLELEVHSIKTSNKYNQSGIPKNKFIQEIILNDNMVKSTVKKFLPLNIRNKLRHKAISMNIEKPKMDSEVRGYLIEFFREDIMKTQNIIGRDLTSWLK